MSRNYVSYDDMMEIAQRIRAQRGAANGVAPLDGSGHVPAANLPSYVDDVLEYAAKSAFPATGESGKIYIAADTNMTYRWGGTQYVEISSSLALGETASTAYPGDKGKANAAGIEEERTARANADTALGGRIDTETSERKNADTAINTALGGKNDKITVTNDTSALTDSDSFDETPAGSNPTATRRRLLSSLWTYIRNKIASSSLYAGITAPRTVFIPSAWGQVFTITEDGVYYGSATFDANEASGIVEAWLDTGCIAIRHLSRAGRQTLNVTFIARKGQTFFFKCSNIDNTEMKAVYVVYGGKLGLS